MNIQIHELSFILTIQKTSPSFQFQSLPYTSCELLLFVLELVNCLLELCYLSSVFSFSRLHKENITFSMFSENRSVQQLKSKMTVLQGYRTPKEEFTGAIYDFTIRCIQRG